VSVSGRTAILQKGSHREYMIKPYPSLQIQELILLSLPEKPRCYARLSVIQKNTGFTPRTLHICKKELREGLIWLFSSCDTKLEVRSTFPPVPSDSYPSLFLAPLFLSYLGGRFFLREVMETDHLSSRRDVV